MGIAAMVDRLGGIEGLDRVGEPLRGAAARLLPPGPVRDAARGKWLGHALHPALTDVPIGLWTSAVVLDAVGGRAAEPSADRLVGLGALAAIPTAVAGLADWSESSPRARRQGVVHALYNTLALGLFGGSLLARRRGSRAAGKRLALLGAAALGGGGYIGAHLAYAEGVSVTSRAAIEPAQPPA